MADLLHGGTSNGNGANPTRPTASPQPTGSPSIRGPRVIMRERQEREARRAEQGRLQRDRDREQLEKQQMEEARRQQAERQASYNAAGAATGAGEPGQRRQTMSEQGRQPRQTAPVQTGMPAPLRPRANTSGDGYAPGQHSTQANEPSRAIAAGRSSFPHAFERWEALSAHWEGLTSFWIRKIEQNASEIDRDPVASQLSRQVTDLSAAGANLFHAVVELQRLRASSERKFQRWFLETRAEIERLGETNGMLQQALEQEKANREPRIQVALQNERDNSKTQKHLTEMKKELAISKEEARRAWDELGRREQEERDRVQNLQAGLPVIIGGIQVVPMTQGVPSRHATQREPQRAELPAEYTQAGAHPPSTSGAGSQGYYAQPGAEGSEGGFSEEGYDDPASFPPQTAAYTTAPDYSGQEYASWEAPRHHHPTRLSDVPEEDDERSRTSASALSRANN